MSKKPKLTPWFPPNIKPHHAGPYQTLRDGWSSAWQNWNGEFWGLRSLSAESAVVQADRESSFQHLPWRGLAADPKGGK